MSEDRHCNRVGGARRGVWSGVVCSDRGVAVSHQPLALLLVKLLCPTARQLQVDVWLAGLVVQVQPRHCLPGHGALYLRALVPLVEGGYGDDVRPHRERRLQRRLVVAAVDTVARVVVVPRTHGRVGIAGANTGHKQ